LRGVGFRRQDYTDIEIKEIFGPSQTAGACSKPRFINVAWDIGLRTLPLKAELSWVVIAGAGRTAKRLGALDLLAL
jgi:hypothetical protein